jgi:predicted O-methyltransferase YrrM
MNKRENSLCYVNLIKKKFPFKSDKYNYAYGDNHTASIYCGFKRTPKMINGEWQHGHIVPERNFHPELVIGSDGLSRFRKQKRYYVARQDQVSFLKEHGFHNVIAIGLPILYVKKPNLTRIKNSLLIMPTHSLPGVENQLDESKFIDRIKHHLDLFDLVVCCIHRNDFDRNIWMESMKGIGIESVTGADNNDVNTYPRLATIFSEFEYMITDDFGSHVSYAAYFGCKVSIIEKIYDKNIYERNMRYLLSNSVFYKNNPELFEKYLISFYENEIYKRNYPFLYKEITKAEVEKNWACYQLGIENMRTPNELRRIFGWNSHQIIFKLFEFYNLKFTSITSIIRKIKHKFTSNYEKIIYSNYLKKEFSIHTHLNLGEKILLYKIAKRLPENAICAEIGSYLGASSCIIAKGLKNQGILYCIDTWENHAMIYEDEDRNDPSLQERDTYFEFHKNTLEYRHKLFELRGWSSEQYSKLKIKVDHLDFLFLDGDHTYESVLLDWDLYSTFLHRDSIVAFHDTSWASGVVRVINEKVSDRAELLYKLPNLQVYKIK